MTRLHILPTCPRDEWNRAYHGARIGVQYPPMVRPAGVPRRTWRLAIAVVLWRARLAAGWAPTVPQFLPYRAADAAPSELQFKLMLDAHGIY